MSPQHENCGHPRTHEARRQCRRITQAAYMAHIECDHPNTPWRRELCDKGVVTGHADCTHEDSPHARSKCRARRVGETPQTMYELGFPISGIARRFGMTKDEVEQYIQREEK